MSLENDVKQTRLFSEALRDYIDNSVTGVREEKLLKVRRRLITFMKDSNDFKEFGVEPNIIRGSIAETMLYYIVQYYKSINPNCFLLEGLLLPTDRGTTQLDSVLFTDKGIYVIEVKSLFGKLFIEKGEITQGVNGMVTTPWSQNRGHIGALANITTLPWEWFHNVVFIFSIGAIESYKKQKDEILVVNQNALSFLQGEEKKKRIADFKIMRGEAEKLKMFIPSIEDEAEHIDRIKTKFQGR